MFHLLSLLGVLILAAAPTFGETISVDGGGVTFEAPKDFKPVPKDILELKYPSTRAPKFVIGNETAGTTIAYEIKPNNLPQEEIEKGRELFTEMFPRMIPGLKWIENKTIEMAGQKWIYFEMTSTAVDTDIYNIMLLTSYKGQMLAFNFNSTKEEFKKYEKAIRTSIKSIKIKSASADETKEKVKESPAGKDQS